MKRDPHPEPSDREGHRAILAGWLQRLLPKIAAKHGLDVARLEAIAQRTLHMCSLCLEPIRVVYLYPSIKEPLGIICGRCNAAIDKTEGRISRLLRHRRFNPDYRANQGRIRRLTELHEAAARD